MNLIQSELDRARREGVTHPENEPFYLPPERPSQSGVLLCHGFGASPWEMRPLAKRLSQAGHHCLGIRLPGHGTEATALESAVLEDWAERMRQGYDLLNTAVSRIYAAGLSTGSLLTLQLSTERALAGQILLAPFLRIRHRLAPLAGLLSRIRPYQSRDIAEEMRPFYYPHHPLRGIHQINRLCRRLKPRLGEVQTPTLVLVTEGDETVSPRSGVELFRRLGTPEKACHIFGPDVPHTLCTPANPRQREVLEMCEAFIAAREGAPKGG